MAVEKYKQMLRPDGRLNANEAHVWGNEQMIKRCGSGYIWGYGQCYLTTFLNMTRKNDYKIQIHK